MDLESKMTANVQYSQIIFMQNCPFWKLKNNDPSKTHNTDQINIKAYPERKPPVISMCSLQLQQIPLKHAAN